MSERSVIHSTIVLERSYRRPSPARVFKAFADPQARARWASLRKNVRA